MHPSNTPTLSYLRELDASDILDRLPTPDRRYRLDRILKQPVDHDAEFVPPRTFETVQWCKSEDKRRADALRAAARAELGDEVWLQMAVERDHAPDDLADDLEKHTGYIRPPLPSRASAIWTRELRLRFLGNTLQFLSEQTDPRASGWITVSRIHWDLEDGVDDLEAGIGLSEDDWDNARFDVPRQFRALMRCSGVIDAPGFLIVCLHAVFTHHKRIRLEFRGICGGEKLQRFRQIDGFIANQANRELIEDYVGGSRFGPFIIASQVIKNLVPGLAAMMPNGVTHRIATRGNPVTFKRPPEPSYSKYITWLHLMRNTPAVIMSGVGVPYTPNSTSYPEQSPTKPLSLCLCDNV
jgi:hypothetical protein